MDLDPRRRHFVASVLALLAGAGIPARSRAQGVAHSVRIINGYQGGSVDVVSRKLAERLTGKLGRVVIVENRTGAAGRVAIEAVRDAPSDGSAMLVTPASVLTMYPHIYKNLSYDVFADLSPVSIVAISAFALAVGPAVPSSVTGVGDFIAWCRSNGASASCGNPGAGSLPHFLAVLLANDAKVDFIHVPYRGGSSAVQAVVGGQVASVLTTEGTILAMARAGKVRVLATTGEARSAFLPGVPIFRELGYPNLDQREWFGAFMPSRTSRDVVAATASELRSILQEPEIVETWSKAALTAESSTPTELQRALRSDHDFWGPVVRASGFTPET